MSYALFVKSNNASTVSNSFTIAFLILSDKSVSPNEISTTLSFVSTLIASLTISSTA